MIRIMKRFSIPSFSCPFFTRHGSQKHRSSIPKTLIQSWPFTFSRDFRCHFLRQGTFEPTWGERSLRVHGDHFHWLSTWADPSYTWGLSNRLGCWSGWCWGRRSCNGWCPQSISPAYHHLWSGLVHQSPCFYGPIATWKKTQGTLVLWLAIWQCYAGLM